MRVSFCVLFVRALNFPLLLVMPVQCEMAFLLLWLHWCLCCPVLRVGSRSAPSNGKKSTGAAFIFTEPPQPPRRRHRRCVDRGDNPPA